MDLGVREDEGGRDVQNYSWVSDSQKITNNDAVSRETDGRPGLRGEVRGSILGKNLDWNYKCLSSDYRKERSSRERLLTKNVRRAL